MRSIEPVFRALERCEGLLPRRDGVEVEFFDAWAPAVSHAYRSLPGTDDWFPAQLLASLIADQRTHRKAVAVLWRNGSLWALVPLRLAGDAWQPLIRGIAEPFADFLCTGRHGEVLGALRLNLMVWNGWVDPRGWRDLRWHTQGVAFQLPLQDPPDRHWRKTDLLKSVIQARRRTEGFEVVRDDPDSAHWLIERWHDFWFTGDSTRLAAKWQDQLTFVDWGLASGAARTWALRDGGRWVAGLFAVVKDNTLTLQTVYRDREYNWYSPGTRLYAEATLWAHREGFERVDFGGSFAYKRWWAQPIGRRYTFRISPLSLHALNWTTDRIAGLRDLVRG